MTHDFATDFLLCTVAGLVFTLGLEWRQKGAVLHRLQATLGAGPSMPAQERLAAGLDWLGARLSLGSDRTVQAFLARAGYHQRAAVAIFVLLRFACMAAVFGIVLARQDNPSAPLAIATALFMAFLCSRILVILLKARGEARQWEIRRELPPVIDILLMVLNSGASIDQCLRYVTGILGETAPIVGPAMQRCVADVDNGVPYDTAFERLGQRLGIEEGHDLAALFKQALLQGGEIVGSLDRFGAELAEKRVCAAREQIGRKAIQLTIVMLLFFMPVLLVILAGPAVSNIFETLNTVKHNIHMKGIHP